MRTLPQRLLNLQGRFQRGRARRAAGFRRHRSGQLEIEFADGDAVTRLQTGLPTRDAVHENAIATIQVANADARGIAGKLRVPA